VLEVMAITCGPSVAEEPFVLIRMSADEFDAEPDQAFPSRIQPSCLRMSPCSGELHGDEMSRS
jgi:hypothetical protein